MEKAAVRGGRHLAVTGLMLSLERGCAATRPGNSCSLSFGVRLFLLCRFREFTPHKTILRGLTLT